MAFPTRSSIAGAYALAVVTALVGLVGSGCATSSQPATSSLSSLSAESHLEGYAPSDVSYDTLYTAQTADVAPQLIGGIRTLVDEEMEYPQEAKRKGINGEVLIGLIVQPDGSTSHIQVVQSVHPLLDREAQRVARQAQFEPGRKFGAAVPVKAVLPFAFRTRTPAQLWGIDHGGTRRCGG